MVDHHKLSENTLITDSSTASYSTSRHTTGQYFAIKDNIFFFFFVVVPFVKNVACLLSGQMRSLRLFYSDSACSAGQVVIASRESQYKILHFHNGGLDRLAEIFQEWSLFARETDKNAMKNFKVKVYNFVMITVSILRVVLVAFSHHPFKDFSGASSLCASYLQAVIGMRSMVLCPKVVFQAPQHF